MAKNTKGLVDYKDRLEITDWDFYNAITTLYSKSSYTKYLNLMSNWGGFSHSSHLWALRSTYLLIGVHHNGRRVKYSYNSPCSYPSTSSWLYLIKSKYSKDELQVIDDLFYNLDEGNLAIIKGIINSKSGKNKLLKDGKQ